MVSEPIVSDLCADSLDTTSDIRTHVSALGSAGAGYRSDKGKVFDGKFGKVVQIQFQMIVVCFASFKSGEALGICNKER